MGGHDGCIFALEIDHSGTYLALSNGNHLSLSILRVMLNLFLELVRQEIY